MSSHSGLNMSTPWHIGFSFVYLQIFGRVIAVLVRGDFVSLCIPNAPRFHKLHTQPTYLCHFWTKCIETSHSMHLQFLYSFQEDVFLHISRIEAHCTTSNCFHCLKEDVFLHISRIEAHCTTSNCFHCLKIIKKKFPVKGARQNSKKG